MVWHLVLRLSFGSTVNANLLPKQPSLYAYDTGVCRTKIPAVVLHVVFFFLLKVLHDCLLHNDRSCRCAHYMYPMYWQISILHIVFAQWHGVVTMVSCILIGACMLVKCLWLFSSFLHKYIYIPCTHELFSSFLHKYIYIPCTHEQNDVLMAAGLDWCFLIGCFW